MADAALNADFERMTLDALRRLTEAVRAVASMSQGGDYEDTGLWSVDNILDQMGTLIDGSGCAP